MDGGRNASSSWGLTDGDLRGMEKVNAFHREMKDQPGYGGHLSEGRSEGHYEISFD
jgi:hypothetical protein